VAGTQRLSGGEPLPEPIPGGYGDALSSVFGLDYPNWSVA